MKIAIWILLISFVVLVKGKVFNFVPTVAHLEFFSFERKLFFIHFENIIGLYYLSNRIDWVKLGFNVHINSIAIHEMGTYKAGPYVTFCTYPIIEHIS